MYTHHLKLAFCCLIALFSNLPLINGQIVINEICPSNVTTIQNSDGKYSDWIELFNNGGTPFDLAGYGLTDDLNSPYQFKFISHELAAGNSILIFASDSNSNAVVDHYEMAVDAHSDWKYVLGSTAIDTNWRNLDYDDITWSTGNGGFGFGDFDDGTMIPPTASVFMRKSFIADTSEILNAIFFMDYDDGFVAYLNGVEIARANMAGTGSRPQWNALAKSAHEAQMYLGLPADSFYLNPAFLKSILIHGTNVLTVETHDAFAIQTDLSSNPYLIFGIKNPVSIYSPTPAWFQSTPSSYYNAKFKLGKTGETIYLFDPSGNIVDQITYPELRNDNSYGRIPDGSSTLCYMDAPTPAEENNSSVCYSGYASAPVFTLASGYYSSAQNLNLITGQTGATIKYTTNGDEPASSSLTYSLPINVSSTTSIRATVFAPGLLPSNTITNTYIIGQDFHLPAFCITTDSLNLWDYNSGIYVLGPNADTVSPYFGANFWQNWQKPASIEYFDKSKNKIFSTNAEIEIYGNYSRYKPQKSFEIKLSDRYGTSELVYPFLSDKPYVTEFDRFVLRNAGTDWNVVHFRDALMQRLMKNTYSGYVGAEPVVMFLNGEFWGIYQFNEKHNQNWVKSNFGFEEDEINYLEIEGQNIIVNEGSDDSFIEMYNYATTASPASNDFYDEMDEELDLKNFADYFIAETYYNNGDWLGEWTNNIKLWKPKIEGGKWKYMLIDTDYGFGLKGSVNDNRLQMARYPTSPAPNHNSEIFDALLDNPVFKNYFINRYADLMNTVYLPTNVENVMKQFKDSMAFDMVAHFAKWGSDTTAWNGRIENMMNFAIQRPAITRNFIRDEFNLTSDVLLTINTLPVGSGRIEISTVTPSVYPWSGIYFNGNPVTITAIPNPGFTFDHWTSGAIPAGNNNQRVTYNFTSDDNIVAYFTGSPALADLTISEINYNSSPEIDADDWIELHNYGTSSLDISGWKVADDQENHKYVFPTGTVLSPGGYLVIPENAHEFREAYPDVTNLIGELGYNLSNSGEEIRIYDYKDSIFVVINYNDQSPWPAEADGLGYTCELLDPFGDINNGNNWYKGCFGGSPGAEFTSNLMTAILISGDSVLCIGSTLQLNATDFSEYIYQWKQDQNIIPGANAELYITSQPGDYSVEVSVDGCSASSLIRHVSEKPFAIISEVYSASRCGAGSVMLSVASNDSVSWLSSPRGNILATGNVFVTPDLSQTTAYFVQAGISCKSMPLEVTATILSEPCDQLVSIFPNPSSGTGITFTSQELLEGTADLTVSNVEGEIVFVKSIIISNDGSSDTIDLSMLAEGIYFVSINQNETTLNAKYVSLRL